MKSLKLSFVFCISLFSVFIFNLSNSISATCGDGICEPKEACFSCPQDCQDPNVVCCKADSPKNGRCSNFDCKRDKNCSNSRAQLIRSGRKPKWGVAKNLIAFDDYVNKKGNSLGCNIYPLFCNFEVLTMKPDGTDSKCLTCNKKSLPKGHKGQPFWHPSGDYITFTAENSNYKRFKDGLDLTVVPSISGRNNNVWIMDSGGLRFLQITDVKEGSGCIRPSFSPDGKTLYWNEEYSLEKYTAPPPWSVQRNPKKEEWGLWRIVLADVSFIDGEPKITNIRKININELYPGKVLIEGQGIQPDNNTLIFVAADVNETAACCRWGYPPEEVFGYAHWSDIYTTDLNGKNLKRLTFSTYNHTENPDYSPDGRKIAFSETKWCVGKNAEVFVMNSDGSNRIQETSFFNPNCSDYIGRYGGAGDELDWSPDSKKIIFSSVNGVKKTYPNLEENIFIIEVEDKVYDK